MKTIAIFSILLLVLVGCAQKSICQDFLPDVRSNFGMEYEINMLQASEFHCTYTRQQSNEYIGINYLVLAENAGDASRDLGADNYSERADGTEYFVENDYSYYYKEEEGVQWLWLSKRNTDVEIMVVFPEDGTPYGYYPREKVLNLALAVSEKVG